ncbi:MAG TPA: 23S rRNA (uracil(1939)-C(5))-methyltransferase RlmD [Thermodesulfobacteriota bacterium]|jgi:23S rRNA (uracil1939-C5)-methyltransferase|nr:23S rRNA (uracil(1939)-C(5))-methyltransferase RlmD [Thermodesulfobacteriota bacterium]
MVKEVYARIESVAFKGYGVARIHGKVVFIPYSVTGDRGWIEILEEKKNYSVGRFVQIVEPSPWRVNAPCPYFGSCGGCQWQHIDYSIHGELKKEILKESLKRLGSLKEIPLISVAPSPQSYDYRIRVQLKVKGKSMGYYQEGSHRIVKIDHCPISHPLVNQIIQNLWEESVPSLPIEEIEINVSPMEGRGALLFHPLSFDQRMEDFLKHFLQSHPILRGIAIARKDGLRLFGDPHLNFTIPWGQKEKTRNLKFRISSGSFSQVNPEQNQRLIQTVLQFSEENKGESVFDLYAGIGNLTLPLALGAKEVFGIEESKMAVRDGRFNAERNGIKNVRFIQGKVKDVLKNLTRKPDLIVLDPPRTGCKTILDQVVRLKPHKIIYVSCEPTTLSRDLRLFWDRGYSLQRLSLIDMFPQTYHMEIIGLLQ